MLSFYSKLSPATQLAISGVGSLLFAAIVTTIAATWQYYTSQGQLNVSALFVFAVGSFGAALTTAAYHYIPTHFREDMAALADINNQLRAQVDRQQIITQSAINKNVTIASQAQTSAAPVVHYNVYVPQQTAQGVGPSDKTTVVSLPAPTHVSEMATASVPAVSIASVDVPQVPFPDYSVMHFGDTGLVPTVSP
jgi:hypothetical protein